MVFLDGNDVDVNLTCKQIFDKIFVILKEANFIFCDVITHSITHEACIAISVYYEF